VRGRTLVRRYLPPLSSYVLPNTRIGETFFFEFSEFFSPSHSFTGKAASISPIPPPRDPFSSFPSSGNPNFRLTYASFSFLFFFFVRTNLPKFLLPRARTVFPFPPRQPRSIVLSFARQTLTISYLPLR